MPVSPWTNPEVAVPLITPVIVSWPELESVRLPVRPRLILPATWIAPAPVRVTPAPWQIDICRRAVQGCRAVGADRRRPGHGDGAGKSVRAAEILDGAVAGRTGAADGDRFGGGVVEAAGEGQGAAVIDDDARGRGRPHGAIRRHDQGAGIDRG